MSDTTDRGNVYQFPTPTEQRVKHASVLAIRLLVTRGLVREREAVKSLEDWGCPESEIELVRTLAAIRRGRVS